LRRFATQRLVVLRDGRAQRLGVVLVDGVLRHLPRLGERGFTGFDGKAKILFELRHEAAVRRGGAQPRQIVVGDRKLLLADRHRRHSVEPFGLLRIGQQQLLPRLRREIGLVMRLPIAALFQQHSGSGVLRPHGVARRGEQQSQNAGLAAAD
jgi:hypothetical protein